MKTKYFFTITLLLILLTKGFSQELSKKEQKESQNEIRMQQIEMILNSGQFIFKAGYAVPMGGRPIDMSTNPGYVIFNKDKMDGNLPFFGSATAGIGLSGDLAIRFNNKPQSFTTRKMKKSYEVGATVRGRNGVYNLSLNIPFDGPSTLTVSSNDRGTISYNGQIYRMDKQK